MITLQITNLSFFHDPASCSCPSASSMTPIGVLFSPTYSLNLDSLLLTFLMRSDACITVTVYEDKE